MSQWCTGKMTHTHHKLETSLSNNLQIHTTTNTQVVTTYTYKMPHTLSQALRLWYHQRYTRPAQIFTQNTMKHRQTSTTIVLRTILSILPLCHTLYYQSCHCVTILSILPLCHYIINPAIVPLYYQSCHCATILSFQPLYHYIINPAIILSIVILCYNPINPAIVPL